MTRFLVYSCFIVLYFCHSDCLAQDSGRIRKPRHTSGRVYFSKAHDSLSIARLKRWKHQDSFRRFRLRDSMRAGYAIHLKGNTITLKTAQGLHIMDSLSHPGYWRTKRKKELDSIRVALQSSGQKLPDAKKYAANVNARNSITSEIISAVPLSKSRASLKLLKGIPYYLQNRATRDTSSNTKVLFNAYIKKHFKLDSLNARLREFQPTPLKLNNLLSKGRILAKPGKVRNSRRVWIIWVLFVMLSLLAFVKARFPRDLQDIVQGVFNDRIIKSSRDSNLIYSPSFILMFIGFCISSALIIYDYLDFLKLQSEYHGFVLFFILAMGILSFFVLKLIAYRLTTVIFNLERLMSPFLSFLYITIAGFTLFCVPLLMIFAFFNAGLLPHLVTWIPFIFLCFLIFLYIRSIAFLISNFEFSKFYLFLYFCALEVCPLIIVYKLING